MPKQTIIIDPRPALLADMDRLGLTYTELERRTGLKAQSIFRTLKSEPSIAERNLAKIAEAISCGKGS